MFAVQTKRIVPASSVKLHRHHPESVTERASVISLALALLEELGDPSSEICSKVEFSRQHGRIQPVEATPPVLEVLV
jgi:hypothetical protein